MLPGFENQKRLPQAEVASYCAAKLGASVGAVNEKACPGGIRFCIIDERIEELGDWRGRTLAKVREIVHQADPEIVEEWKWMGTPVWSHGCIVCTGETYKTSSR